MKYRLVQTFLLSAFLVTACSQKRENIGVNNKKENDTIRNDISNEKIENDTIESSADLIDVQHFERNKTYTDTVIFQQYMDYGDFDRFHVKVRGKNLYPVNSDDDRSLNRGDIAILTWGVDNIWIPESPNDKWLSEFSKSIRKIKDGRLSVYKKKYPQQLSYNYDNSIKEKYSNEDFDEIYNLVKYYLANSKQSLVLSNVKNQSDSVQIQYSIEEQDREENGNKVTYTVIGLSTYFENHNSIFQWLYLKRNDYGYRDIYEYDLPNDQLIFFN